MPAVFLRIIPKWKTSLAPDFRSCLNSLIVKRTIRSHTNSKGASSRPFHLSQHQGNRARPAFTIVELLIVIVVIAILAVITAVAFNGIQARANEAAMKSSLAQAAKKLSVTSVTNDNVYPATLSDAGITTDSRYSYLYRATNNNTGYCLSVASGSASYRVTDQESAPTAGACSGILADGTSCPTGFIAVPGSATYGTSDFCVAKYEAKNVGGVATSQASGTPWVSISQTSAITTAQAACTGCHLITEAEWMTLAQNVLSVPSNWSGGAVGSGYIYSGHNDNAPANALAANADDNDGYNGTGNTTGNQRRTLSLTNGETIWDMAGNVYEWTAGQTTGNQPGASANTGFQWTDWPSVNVIGSLAVNPFPSGTGLSGASSWNAATNGIGRLYSYTADATLRGFFRGGNWLGTSHAGVLALYLNYAPSTAGGSIGFRVAR